MKLKYSKYKKDYLMFNIYQNNYLCYVRTPLLHQKDLKY